MLEMEVENLSIPTHEDLVIENIDDCHVKDEIAYFYSGNNIKQIPLICGLSLVQDLHDNDPLETTSFEIVLLKVDENHSNNREAFHCLHFERFYFCIHIYFLTIVHTLTFRIILLKLCYGHTFTWYKAMISYS